MLYQFKIDELIEEYVSYIIAISTFSNWFGLRLREITITTLVNVGSKWSLKMMLGQSFKQICIFVLVHCLQIKVCRELHKITCIAIFWTFSEEILSTGIMHVNFTTNKLFEPWCKKIFLH
jgi:hypothetical protein